MKLQSILFILAAGIYACSPSKQIAKSAKKNVLADPALQTAHVGISVYEPARGKFWFNYQADKYFVPASNTKLPTCYAAMKYLGDSLVGLSVTEYTDYIFIDGTADPTLLHEDFKKHPVYDFLKSLDTGVKPVRLGTKGWKENAWGLGWSWSDYDADYMAERSALPVYGNLVRFSGKLDTIKAIPDFFNHNINTKHSTPGGYLNRVERAQFENKFNIFSYGSKPDLVRVPFITSPDLNLQLLEDSLHNKRQIIPPGSAPPIRFDNELPRKYFIYSHPTDSLLRPMMHNSDNFFAEQTLLMVSNERLGEMNDAKIIDTLLKTDLKDLPQQPRWVDGSGLSRFNLFTPQDFVAILDKMKNEFGMERIQNILATGDEGTLEGRYRKEVGYIFAKTGTLSGVVALSGFLYTKKNRLLIFSILVNNHRGSATPIRDAMEKFVRNLRDTY